MKAAILWIGFIAFAWLAITAFQMQDWKVGLGVSVIALALAWAAPGGSGGSGKNTKRAGREREYADRW